MKFIYNKCSIINNLLKTSSTQQNTQMSLGCGEKDCININNDFFCSTTCKKRAIQCRFIKDPEDIDYNESGFKITSKAKERLFGKDLTLKPTILKDIVPDKNLFVGCGDVSCVNIKNKYFCSRSCLNAAVRDGFIDYFTDIDYDESNLMLTENAHLKLFS